MKLQPQINNAKNLIESANYDRGQTFGKHLDELKNSFDSAMLALDKYYGQAEVDSALVRFVRKEPVETAEFRKFFATFVRTAFAHRRKKMFKQLTAVVPPDRLTEAMAACGAAPDIRAERVTVEQFIAMAKMILSKGR